MPQQQQQTAQAHSSAAPAASRAAPPIAYPGCTALAALVVEGRLLVANAGVRLCCADQYFLRNDLL